MEADSPGSVRAEDHCLKQVPAKLLDSRTVTYKLHLVIPHNHIYPLRLSTSVIGQDYMMSIGVKSAINNSPSLRLSTGLWVIAGFLGQSEPYQELIVWSRTPRRVP